MWRSSAVFGPVLLLALTTSASCGTSGATQKAGASGTTPATRAAKGEDPRGSGASEHAGKKGSALPRALRHARVKVTYTALVRHRCYFAQRTLRALFEATNELRAEGRLQVEYIADPALAAGGCKRRREVAHRGFCTPRGKVEVEGAIANLCAAKLAKDRAARRRFLDCSVTDWTSSTPWRRCAGVARIAPKPLAACIKGAQGEALLRASMQRAKLGQKHGSPTLLVNGKRYRGGRDRLSLLRGGCSADASMAACSKLPKVVPVKAIVLTDKRCKSCKYEGVLRNMQGRFFPGLKLRVVDYASAEGKKLYSSLKIKLLPVWLFEKGVEQADRYDRVKRWMIPLGPYLKMRLPARWDPTAEICDNGKDDTGNGKVDCQDSTCSAKLICRKATPRRIDLFLMSHCPFANKALQALDSLFAKRKTFARRLTFRMHYIVTRPRGRRRCYRNERPVRGFCALHGAEAVRENMRRLCAARLYGRKNEYLRYIFCRTQNYRSKDWRVCTGKGISAKRIQRCVKRRGKKLLTENFKLTSALKIVGSPTWLSNNRRKFSGINKRAILDNFCKDNPKEKLCKGLKP
jgi:hypothetical protein